MGVRNAEFEHLSDAFFVAIKLPFTPSLALGGVCSRSRGSLLTSLVPVHALSEDAFADPTSSVNFAWTGREGSGVRVREECPLPAFMTELRRRIWTLILFSALRSLGVRHALPTESLGRGDTGAEATSSLRLHNVSRTGLEDLLLLAGFPTNEERREDGVETETEIGRDCNVLCASDDRRNLDEAVSEKKQLVRFLVLSNSPDTNFCNVPAHK
jgi:hypothetical protein